MTDNQTISADAVSNNQTIIAGGWRGSDAVTPTRVEVTCRRCDEILDLFVVSDCRPGSYETTCPYCDESVEFVVEEPADIENET